MREHDDLKSGPISATTDTTPTYKIVQPDHNNWVLVLDTSGSMKGERLRQLRQAASNFINTAIQLYESLSIISFNGTVTINAPLREIRDQGDRNALIEALPTKAAGISNIGEGIQFGRAQLANKNIFGGRMLVITDGEENSSPSISNIIHLLDDYQITVDTIAIGPESDEDLESLTRVTGGQSFYHSGSSSTLDEAFKAFSERNRDTSDALITVFTKSVQLAPTQTDTSDVIIDASIGGDTQFLFDYSQGDASIEGTLTGPGGITITKTDSEYVTDTDFSLTRITITGQATAGPWQLNLMNTSPSPQNVTIIVQSRARKDGSGNQVDPIRATATWGKESVGIMGDTVATNNQTLFVTVSKGYVPVLNAGVTATVSVPGGDVQPFAVNDDGLGADIQENDGIYSAFLTEFKGEGRYGMSVMVENTGNTAMLSPATVLGQGSIIHPDDEQVWSETPAGQFQRVVNGGSFTCEGVFCAGTIDVFPPARILDLEANILDLAKPDVTLSYTAPGDNLMTGTVSTYEIRSSKGNINILYDDFESADLVTTILGNNLARSKESFTVPSLDIGPHSYFFAIVAIDDSSHRSLVSNIASASMRFVTLPPGATFPPEPTTTTQLIPTTDGGNFQPSPKTEPASTSLPLKPTLDPNGTAFTPLLIAIVVAAPLIAILLALLLLACCLFCGCCKRKQKGNKNLKTTEAQPNGEMPIYGNVNDPNQEFAPESAVDDTRVAVLVFPNADAADMSAAAESSMTPTRTARVVSNAGDTGDMLAAATPAASMTPTLTARVVSRTEDDFDNAGMSAPISTIDRTRKAVVVTQDDTPAGPSSLQSKPDVRQNFYSELPDRKNGYANGRKPGLRRDGTYYQNYRRDSSSSEEDEISREKNRMKQMNVQEPEYY
ncbi:calcium-activated chloride channel regulator 4-like [Amphiura filiformis]|uniref:calcium-activated chloride channel regulator 4-like n=1 Tax=Amphiura filiformis TaxID=82378 RepID=UPI003B213507